MTINEKQSELVRYRLKQAEESLDEAELLTDDNPRKLKLDVYMQLMYTLIHEF